MRVDGTNEWFAATNRTPGVALVTDPVLTLPVIEASTSGDAGDGTGDATEGSEVAATGHGSILPATGGGTTAGVLLILAGLVLGVYRRSGRA